MAKRLLVLCALLASAACASLAPKDGELPKNFGIVETDAIYRGAQPSDAEIHYLKLILGVKSILKLNGGDKDSEAAACAKYGVKLKTFNFKPSTIADPGSAKEVREAYLFMTDPANWPIYVHCKHGKDRTGFIVGLRRLAQGWPLAQVKKELRRYGNILYPSIRRTLRKHTDCVAREEYGTSNCPPQKK